MPQTAGLLAPIKRAPKVQKLGHPFAVNFLPLFETRCRLDEKIDVVQVGLRESVADVKVVVSLDTEATCECP